MFFSQGEQSDQKKKQRGDAMQIPVQRVRLDESAMFGFTCRRCKQCCRDKLIQVNPYESARLSAFLGIGTTEFLKRYTVRNGTYLRLLHDGTCCFLGPEGCSVHPHRPLVCRLYPLSRHVTHTGEDWFAELETEAGCRGSYHRGGRITEYLLEQGAEPFMTAADRYLNLIWEMMNTVDSCSEPNSFSACLPGYLNWMDMDAVVTDYCRRRNLQVPEDIGKRARFHIEALRSFIG